MKRDHDDGDDGRSHSKTSKFDHGEDATNGADAKDVARCLIEKRQMGIIIGKGGSKITQVRESTQCQVSIIKPERETPDRLVKIEGVLENIGEAIKQITQQLLDAAAERAQKSETTPDSDTLTTVSWKILIDKSQVGCIIGKGGAAIQKTQADTGARIKVETDLLPGSSEKICQISGSVEAVHQATMIVLDQLKNSNMDPSRFVQYVPGAAPAAPAYSPSPYADPRGGPYAPPPRPYDGHSPYDSHSRAPPPAPAPYGSYRPDPYASSRGHHHSSSHSSRGESSNSSEAQAEQKIVIPASSAGSIIGRGGSTIKSLQAQTGTTMSISPPDKENPSERIVTIKGTNAAIDNVLLTIRQMVESDSAHQHHQQYAPPPSAGAPPPHGYY